MRPNNFSLDIVLEDVDAVLHIACALPGRMSPEATFKVDLSSSYSFLQIMTFWQSAIEGTIHVVRQTQQSWHRFLIV